MRLSKLPASRKQDAIPFHGKASDYRLGASPAGKGTAIFRETGKGNGQNRWANRRRVEQRQAQPQQQRLPVCVAEFTD
ncbi:MAG: hypothetical protein SNJ57_15985 [Cyanobacteriota bacterium]